jgi:hypothetical protein
LTVTWKAGNAVCKIVRFMQVRMLLFNPSCPFLKNFLYYLFKQFLFRQW